MFDLQELTHEELANHRQAKKDLARANEFKRETVEPPGETSEMKCPKS